MRRRAHIAAPIVATAHGSGTRPQREDPARVLYRDFRSRGFSRQQIIAVVAKLIACVLEEMDAPV